MAVQPPPRPPEIKVRRVGNWRALTAAMEQLDPAAFQIALDKALDEEGEMAVKNIRKNLKTNGRYAGKPFLPVSSFTKAARRLRGSMKRVALNDTGGLAEAFEVKRTGKRSRKVQVNPTAKTSRSKGNKIPLSAVASMNENGAQFFISNPSRAFFKFLGLVMGKSKSYTGASSPGNKGTIMIKIPKRPFVKPVHDKMYGNRQKAKRRMQLSIAKSFKLLRSGK